MREIANNIGAVPAIVPAVQSASVNGLAVDTAGYNRVAFVVTTGAVAGFGDFSAKLQESDTTTSGDFDDVAAGSYTTNAPSTLAADSSYRLGYLGNKRYVRVVLTKGSGTSVAAGAVAIFGDPRHSPVA